VQKPKAAIFTSADSVWLLPAWFHALPRIADAVQVSDIWVFPDKFGKRSGGEMLWWYLSVFGLGATIKLALFAIFAKIRWSLRGRGGWEWLARKNNLHFHQGANPNREEVIDWVRESQVDLVLATTGFIFKPDLLRAPRIGCINKHASLLPACKGLFPYIAAHTYGIPLGMSFHLMTEEIDGGEILVQKTMSDARPGKPAGSMVEFYTWVYECFGEFLKESLENLRNGSRFTGTLAPSYFSLPTAKEMRAFRQKGGRIIRMADLWRNWPQ
jgi:hypothetical protein